MLNWYYDVKRVKLLYLHGFPFSRNEIGNGDELDSVSQTGFHRQSSEDEQRVLLHFSVFFLAPVCQIFKVSWQAYVMKLDEDPPDFQNLLHFFFLVGLRSDNNHPIQQVDWDTVRGSILGPTDLRDTSVGRHNQNGSHVIF